MKPIEKIRVFTIGFTKKSAEDFFEKLRHSGARRLLDVRLHNNSQLAGFAKARDLEYFLRELVDMEYLHLPHLLAPTQELKDGMKSRRKGVQRLKWYEFEEQFLHLMERRKIEDHIQPSLLHQACLLCSEAEPTQCHRRLIVEYLQKKWAHQCQLQVTHL